MSKKIVKAEFGTARSILLKEFKKFSKTNWWVYIIFFVCLLFIYKTNSGNILEISLVFMFHFLGDLFIMMMGDYFANKEEKKGLYAQTMGFVIFTGIGIYSGIRFGKWNYLLPQTLFVWPIIKGFYPKFKFINYKFLLGMGIIVFLIYYFNHLIHSIGDIIQIFGFIIFPIALLLKNDKYRYFLSLLGIFLIFLGSAFFLYNGFLNKNVSGTDLSYTLLPLTVLVFYLRNIKKYL